MGLLPFSHNVARFTSCYYYQCEHDKDAYSMEASEDICLTLGSAEAGTED